MSKVIHTTTGKVYAVTTPSGCNVYADEAGTQLIKTVDPGQGYFVAIGAKTWIDDDTAIVTETFNGAARKLRLLAGGGTNSLPAGYTRVEWIKSPDVSYKQAHTEVPISATLLVDQLDIETDNRWVNSMDRTRFEGYMDNESNELLFGLLLQDGEIKTAFQSRIRGSNIKAVVGNAVEYNTWYTYRLLVEPNGKCSGWLNGSLLLSVTHGSVATAMTSIGVLCGRPKAQYIAGAQKSFWKLKINGELKNDLIACLDETGAPCMYDRVTKQAFYSITGTDFDYALPASGVSTWALRRPVAEYAKMTPNGVRRLYKLPDNYTGDAEQYIADNGFKRLVEAEQPTEGYWTPQWRETDTELILDWVETEPPADEPSETTQQ